MRVELELDGVTWTADAEQVTGPDGLPSVKLTKVVGIDWDGNSVSPTPEALVDLVAHAAGKLALPPRTI